MSIDWIETEFCKVACCDCRDALAAVKADAVVTDPPYGIGFAAQPTKWQRRAGQKPESWDDKPADVSGVLDIAPIVVIWGGNYYPLPASRGWLSWYKPDAPPSMASFELAWTNRDMNGRQIVHTISATNAERVGHPNQKPLRVMEWCMDRANIPHAAVVFDPFMGSGTTAVACIRTGRRFIGCEIDPKYFEIALRRIREAEGAGGLFEHIRAAPEPELFGGMD